MAIAGLTFVRFTVIPGNLGVGEPMSDLNDPRVFFAAERTLMAWTRTALTLMGFGFALERFGLFLYMLMKLEEQTWQREASFWVGVSFIAIGTVVGFFSVVQYRRVLKTLKPVEIPEGYWVNMGVYTNLILGILGIVIMSYFFIGLH
jgi:putative membrane protein